ncbi:HAD family hydrolase [Vibrio mediterranei]
MQVSKVAFFDVDETLINCKSMFDFQEYYLQKKHGRLGKLFFQLYWKIIKILASMKVDRVKINAFYYRLYKNQSYQSILDVGESWYNYRRNKRGFFKDETITLMKNLQGDGFKIVFVSGSFQACLEPIRRELDADEILCAELELSQGKITGRLSQRAIGKYKADLVHKYLIKNKINSDNCYAVGDHISDLDMLSIVGNPIVVRNCEKLEKIAIQENWQII